MNAKKKKANPPSKRESSDPAPFLHAVSDEENLQTLAALFRKLRPEFSWSQVRKCIEGGNVTIQGEICRDSARRLNAGEQVELFGQVQRESKKELGLQLCFLDRHVVVTDKPSGMPTVRHRKEKNWSRQRRALSPTAEDEVRELIAIELDWKHDQQTPPVHVVHRIDKHTSGLVVFARTTDAEASLMEQFRERTPTRIYHAIVWGHPEEQTITSRLIRNRGDGLRGSTTQKGVGQEAITHVRPIKKIGKWSLVECQLETGRTHQIRIHLAEAGYPVCGDPVYFSPLADGTTRDDTSQAPRLALHATKLIIIHPVAGNPVEMESPLPNDLQEMVDRMSGQKKKVPKKQTPQKN